jgi:hypothetical protein
MKMKKLAKSQKKLKKSVRKLGKKNNPPWVTALAAIAGAVATALSDDRKRGRMKELALDTKDRAKRLVHTTASRDDDEMEEASDDMPNGIMEENAGPV